MMEWFRKQNYRHFHSSQNENLLVKLNPGVFNLSIFYRMILNIFKDGLTMIVTQMNSLSANPTKWSNTLKRFVGSSRRIVFECV